MSGHIRVQCEHGTIIAQCRCADLLKTIVIRPCPDYCTKKGS